MVKRGANTQGMEIYLFTAPYIAFAVSFVLLLLGVLSKNEQMTLVFAVGALVAAFYAFGYFGVLDARGLYQPAIAMGALVYTFTVQGTYRVAGFLVTLLLFMTI